MAEIIPPPPPEDEWEEPVPPPPPEPEQQKSNLLSDMINKYKENVAATKSFADARWGDTPMEKAKTTAIAAAQVAPLFIAPQLGIAKGLVPTVLNALKFGLKAGGISAASKAVESALQGGDVLGETTKAGLTGGALGTGLGLAVKPLLAIGSQAKKIVKSLSSVDSNAIDYAIANPAVLEQPQKSYIDIAGDLNDRVSKFTDDAKEMFDSGLKNIISQYGNSSVETKGIPELLRKLTKNPKNVSKALSNYAIKDELYNVSPTIFDDLVNGRPISLEDARIINSVLHDIVKTPGKIGSGLHGMLGKVKFELLSNIDEATKGLIKPLNKAYAESINAYDDIQRIIGDAAASEGKLSRIGRQLLTGKGTNTFHIQSINKIDPEILTQMKMTETANSFLDSTKKGISLMRTSPFALGGSLAGASMGGPVGGAIGYGAGALIGQRIESPESTKAIIDILNKTRLAQGVAKNILGRAARSLPGDIGSR